jgi:hypothetical protein
MKHDDSRLAARFESLMPSQVKALLLVASDAGLASDVERLLDAATAEGTSLDELVRLKERAKAIIADASDARGREAARVLYHAAVAAALVRHGQAISGRLARKQRTQYEALAGAWAGHALEQLFRDAAHLLQDR